MCSISSSKPHSWANIYELRASNHDRWFSLPNMLRIIIARTSIEIVPYVKNVNNGLINVGWENICLDFLIK